MTARTLSIPKRYSDGEAYLEEYVDDFRLSVTEWALSSVRNLNQVVLDVLGSNYSLDNDGNANRNIPLIDYFPGISEDEEITGDWTISGDFTFSGTTTFTGAASFSGITGLQINDTSADHQYVFAVNELSADRTVTLPLLAGDDEFAFLDHTQTLTNKTLTAPTLTTPAVTSGSLNITGDIPIYMDGTAGVYRILHSTSGNYLELRSAVGIYSRLFNSGGLTVFNESAADQNAQIGVQNDASAWYLRIDGSDGDNLKIINDTSGETEVLEFTTSSLNIPTNISQYFDGGSTYRIIHPTASAYLQIQTGADNTFKFYNSSGFNIENAGSNSNAQLGLKNDAVTWFLRVDGSASDLFKLVLDNGTEETIINSGQSGGTLNYWNVTNTDTNGDAALSVVNDAGYYTMKIMGSSSDKFSFIYNFGGGEAEVFNISASTGRTTFNDYVYFGGVVNYYLSSSGDISARQIGCTFNANIGVDTTTLYLDGSNAGAGGHSLIQLMNASVDWVFDIESASTTAAGSYYGRIAVKVSGVGTKYIHLFNA